MKNKSKQKVNFNTTKMSQADLNSVQQTELKTTIKPISSSWDQATADTAVE